MQTPAQTNLSSIYYWDNYQFVLRYIKKHYKDLLFEPEIDFLNQFDLLSKSAQCLYLRLCSRSTPWFLTHKINYPEIDLLPDALQELIEFRFLQRYSADTLLPELLHVLTKERCLEIAHQLFPIRRFQKH